VPHCPHCSQRIPTGQARLSRGEIKHFDYEGADGFPNVIKLQAVKGAASHLDPDWVSQTDSSLSMGENIGRMEQLGEPTMRDLHMTDGGESGRADKGGSP
jgi:hypothetical protein